MPINPALIRRKLPENSVFKNIQRLYGDENAVKKLNNMKNNTSSLNKESNSPTSKKTVYFTEAKKTNVNNEPCFCPEEINNQNNSKESKLKNSFSNEVTKDDFQSILLKLKTETKDYIIVRSSLLNLLESLISNMPTKDHLKQMQENMMSMNDRIIQLDNLNRNKDKKIASLEKELTKKNNNISELENEIIQWRGNIDKLKVQIKTLSGYMEELEKREDKNNDLINDKNKKLDDYKNMLEDNKKEINGLMSKHDNEIKKIRYSLEECKKILEDRDITIENLQNKVKDLQKKNKELANKHKIELNNKKELIQKNQNIQKMLNDLKKNKDALYNKFKSDSLEYKKKIDDLNNDCVIYEKKLNDYQKLLQDKDANNKYQNIKINEQFKRMNGKLNSIENQLRKRDRDVDSLMSDVSNVEKRVKINEKRWNRVVRLTNKLYYTVHSRRNNNEGNNSSSGYSS
ncbi:hypothetical protein U3516DRAFT_565800 [Neocallimastix sp. 'constans']